MVALEMGVRVLETLEDYKHPLGLRHGYVDEWEAWCLAIHTACLYPAPS